MQIRKGGNVVARWYFRVAIRCKVVVTQLGTVCDEDDDDDIYDDVCYNFYTFQCFTFVFINPYFSVYTQITM